MRNFDHVTVDLFKAFNMYLYIYVSQPFSLSLVCFLSFSPEFFVLCDVTDFLMRMLVCVTGAKVSTVQLRLNWRTPTSAMLLRILTRPGRPKNPQLIFSKIRQKSPFLAKKNPFK